MKINKWILSNGMLALFAAGMMLSATGCGPDTSPEKEDPAKTAQRVESATKMRQIYDKSNGDFDSLTQPDKDELIKATGSEANAKTAFAKMGGPKAAPAATNSTPAPAQNGLPASGPGGNLH